MSFRLYRTLSLFPGVRLHLGGHGLSVTVGVPGASVNFGPVGQTLKLGIPGTGISYRQRLSAPSAAPSSGEPRWEEPQFTPSGPDAASVALPGEIRSTHVAQLTSRDLEGLKRLINKAAGRRRGLSTQLRGDVAARDTAWRALERARKFPLRPFRRGSVPGLQAAFDARKDAVEERAAEYDACHVHVDFAFGDEALGAYRDLSAAHARLARSQRVWDVTSSVAIDRVAQRTTAGSAVTRTPTSLASASSGIVATRWKGLGFGNANGEDIEFFPGFCLVRDRKGGSGDFALVELRDLRLESASVRFVETDGVPSDAEVIGHTWEKANKDGSPDRRFGGNRQIPIAHYGEIVLRSPGWIHEACLACLSRRMNRPSASVH